MTAIVLLILQKARGVEDWKCAGGISWRNKYDTFAPTWVDHCVTGYELRQDDQANHRVWDFIFFSAGGLEK